MVCSETKIPESLYVFELTVRVFGSLVTHMTDDKKWQGWQQ